MFFFEVCQSDPMSFARDVRQGIVSGGFDWARRPTQVPHDCESLGPAQVGVGGGAKCLVAMGFDTESVISGCRSHHSLEDALEMDLEFVSLCCYGQDELVSWEERVFEVPVLRGTSLQIRAVFKWMDRGCGGVVQEEGLICPFGVALHSCGRTHCHRTRSPNTKGGKFFCPKCC